MRTHHALLLALATACMATTARAAVGDVVLRETTQQTPIRVEVVAEGLDTPWGLAFLPDGCYLVTERDGRLRVVGKDGSLSAPVGGVPEVQAPGRIFVLRKDAFDLVELELLQIEHAARHRRAHPS